MTTNVNVRDTLRSVRVRVWGGDEQQIKDDQVVLHRVVEYVQAAFFSGLDEEDMEDDIIDKFPAFFEDGQIEFEPSGDILVVLVPVEH